MSTVDPHAGHAHTDDEMPKHHDAPATGPTDIDPVCGMTVTLKQDRGMLQRAFLRPPRSAVGQNSKFA